MRFHAKYVSASEAGDYYQVSFDTQEILARTPLIRVGRR